MLFGTCRSARDCPALVGFRLSVLDHSWHPREPKTHGSRRGRGASEACHGSLTRDVLATIPVDVPSPWCDNARLTGVALCLLPEPETPR